MSGRVRCEVFGSGSDLPLPFHVPSVIPFILLKRPPFGPCPGTFWPNWDGTPAHSSGALSHEASRRQSACRRQRRSVS
jgi:hypothetical protein